MYSPISQVYDSVCYECDRLHMYAFMIERIGMCKYVHLYMYLLQCEYRLVIRGHYKISETTISSHIQQLNEFVIENLENNYVCLYELHGSHANKF